MKDLNDALQAWSDEQKHCRINGHSWRPLDVAFNGATYLVTQRCVSCENRRAQVVDRRGYAMTPWKQMYERGYLIPGRGRVDIDDKAVIRLQNIRALIDGVEGTV